MTVSMAVSKVNSEVTCCLSWVLVEEWHGQERELHALHIAELIGDDNVYVDRKVEFIVNKEVRSGIVLMLSQKHATIEAERERLLREDKKAARDEQQNKNRNDLWCLVRVIDDEERVNIQIISCQKLSIDGTPPKKRFFIRTDDGRVPVVLLHIIHEEHLLKNEMAFMRNILEHTIINGEDNQEVEQNGLMDSYLLVQYFDNPTSLVYTIVKYSDTVWKNQNPFATVVAYILNGEAVSQCVILRKSNNKDDLKVPLAQIRETWDKVDYALLLHQLAESTSTPTTTVNPDDIPSTSKGS